MCLCLQCQSLKKQSVYISPTVLPLEGWESNLFWEVTEKWQQINNPHQSSVINLMQIKLESSKKTYLHNRVTLNIKNPRITISSYNLRIFLHIFIIQVQICTLNLDILILYFIFVLWKCLMLWSAIYHETGYTVQVYTCTVYPVVYTFSWSSKYKLSWYIPVLYLYVTDQLTYKFIFIRNKY